MFFGSVQGIMFEVQVPTKLRPIFPVQIEKTFIIVFIAKELKIKKATSLCNDFTLPGHGVTLQWLCSFYKSYL